jgi:lipopolysaccharide/colanic/teichoic acid biosynthesis glycosyltransferase
MLFVLAPLLVLVGLIVKITSLGPVLCRKAMVGRGGHPFEGFKFRTMGAAQVTGIGKVLRAGRIDYLPLLLNVIRGEMGFVGPRHRYEEGWTFKRSTKRDSAIQLVDIHEPGTQDRSDLLSGMPEALRHGGTV